MGNKSSLLLREEEIAQIQEETGCKYINMKSNKYYDLTEEMIRNGFKTQLYAVEVGARGVPAKSLHHLLGLSRSAVNTFMKRASETALTESYSIWLDRESRMVDVTPNQIERLYSRFTSLDKSDCGTLAREDFLRIPELAINPLSERIVHSFFAESHDDRVNFLQFMRVLAHFRPIRENRENKLNSREEKLRFAFSMYDLDNDGKISRDELLAILHMMVGVNISEEQLTSIAERTIIEADTNNDQMISYDEFCTALERTDVEQKMSIRFLN